MTVKRPVVLVGCGRLGSALVEGWLSTGTLAPTDLTLLIRGDNPAVDAFRIRGVAVNPDRTSTDAVVVLAVKPAQWREAVAALSSSPPTTVVSVMAGVRAAEIHALTGAAVARVMPTTGVAQARGVAALWSGDATALAAARSLFERVADVVELDDERLLDPATAVAGSAPAFIHAFVQDLARAGAAQGLPPAAAIRLARGALRSAAAGLEGGQALDDLISRIASPGGTTRAGLDALKAGGMDALTAVAVAAAVKRARELGSS